jgi:hypothetical protein
MSSAHKRFLDKVRLAGLDRRSRKPKRTSIRAGHHRAAGAAISRRDRVDEIANSQVAFEVVRVIFKQIGGGYVTDARGGIAGIYNRSELLPDTRSLQAYLGHKNIQHTVRYGLLTCPAYCRTTFRL